MYCRLQNTDTGVDLPTLIVWTAWRAHCHQLSPKLQVVSFPPNNRKYMQSWLKKTLCKNFLPRTAPTNLHKWLHYSWHSSGYFFFYQKVILCMFIYVGPFYHQANKCHYIYTITAFLCYNMKSIFYLHFVWCILTFLILCHFSPVQ